MAPPDLNLLAALDVLLAEGSVARAARRLRLSPSAMSRTLARLREATGDPLLVRAGRDLVPSPRALEIRGRIGLLVDEAQAMLRPAHALELARLERTFTLRAREGFVENFGVRLLARVGREAPGVRLDFLPKADKDSALLRGGVVDLETGVVGPATSPDLRALPLFEDRFIGVARAGHPLSEEQGDGQSRLARYAQARHVNVSRRGLHKGPVDEALAACGMERRLAATVDSFSAALALARGTDLVASVPERHTRHLRDGLHGFELPVPVPPIAVSLLWHPRLDGDAAHRWLRGCVRDICAEPPAGLPPTRAP